MFTLLALCCVMVYVARGSADPCSAKTIILSSDNSGTIKTVPVGAENCASFSGGVVSIFMTPGHDLTLPNLESIEGATSSGYTKPALTINQAPFSGAGGWTLSMPKLKSISGSIVGQSPTDS